MEVGYMKKDENCFCFQRNVSFFKSVYSLNFHVRLAYSLLFLCMAHTTFLQHLSWSFMTVGLYYIQRSRRISFGHWTELPPCNLFICLFSWYDFVRNLGGLYGVSVSQALALNFAVFSLSPYSSFYSIHRPCLRGFFTHTWDRLSWLMLSRHH